MANYDYGNARLRAMKSRLLDRAKLRELAHLPTVEGVLAALRETPYRPAIETALIRLAGLPCLMEALRLDFSGQMERIGRFYEGEAGRRVELLFDRFTIDNLKGILRGLSQQLPAETILAAVVPLGELSAADLQKLAAAPDPRSAVDLLASWASTLALPLLEVRAQEPHAPVARLEIALERWYAGRLTATGPHSEPWATYVRTTIDRMNLLSALRLVGRPQGRQQIAHFFLAPPAGGLQLGQLQEIADQPNLNRAVAELDAPPYAAALQAALAGSPQPLRLSRCEQTLLRQETLWAAGRLISDPLGIGTVLGYLALKRNEIVNLRLIGIGIFLITPPERIIDQLFLLTPTGVLA